MEQRTIVIVVEGGAIQNVLGVPKGVQVHIHDYDTEGALPQNVTEDSDGNTFYCDIWLTEEE